MKEKLHCLGSKRGHDKKSVVKLYLQHCSRTEHKYWSRAVTITALPFHRGNEMPTAVLRSSPSSPHFFSRDPSRFLAKRE